MTSRLHAVVRGTVQGVGFRDWVRRTAEPLGLAGSAVNLPDGSVEIVAEGSRDAAERLLHALDGRTPGLVTSVDHDWSQPRGEIAFRTG